MADEERPDDEQADAPSLELPSLKSALGLRRTRKPGRVPPEAAPEPSAADDAETTVEPALPPEEPPVEPTEPDLPETPDEPPTEPVVPVPPAEPGPEVSPGPIGLPETQPEVDPTADLPAAMAAADEGDEPRRRSRPRIALTLPGPLVAVLTGAIVGLGLVGLTSASLHLCSAMRGTSSCGKPGILLLLVITAAMVFLGSLLLRLAGIDAHGSTSFLGVGLLVVVILIALLPVIFRWWMVIVIPGVGMLTYAASWWLTTTQVEPGQRLR